MARALELYEKQFGNLIQNLTLADRQKAGALLSVIPERLEWENYISVVKSQVSISRAFLWDNNPYCLIVLYGGMAFFEYEDNSLWPQFKRVLDLESIQGNRQRDINRAFADAAKAVGLKILEKETRTEYVGSAVYHAGIPLSLWDGFLDICEWAWRRDDWKDLNAEQWEEFVSRRAGGRIRLKRFLCDNRETTTQFVQDMIDAKNILKQNPNYSIKDIADLCFIRQEYFEEVPETVEFLRPNDPDSLFKHKPQLSWNNSSIVIRLPGVEASKLPAVWQIGDLPHPASSGPSQRNIDRVAFQKRIVLKLESGDRVEEDRLEGLDPWGLYNVEKSRFINSNRRELPLAKYDLICKREFDKISLKGFNEEDLEKNSPYPLTDDSICYVTRLDPVSKFPKLDMKLGGNHWSISFNVKYGLEANLFFGEGSDACKYYVSDDIKKMGKLPILCVAIPDGYFDNNEYVLRKKFKISVNNDRGYGEWERRYEDEGREFYIFNWDKVPVEREIENQTFNDLKRLSEVNLTLPDPLGEKVISISAPQWEIKFDWRVEIIKPLPYVDSCWRNLPGDYLIWFLLDQKTEGMSWNDLLMAQSVISPESRISLGVLRKYAKYGFVAQHGRIWKILESRAAIKSQTGVCTLEYCGRPSLLWELTRIIANSSRSPTLTKRRRYVRDRNKSGVPLTLGVQTTKRSLPFLVLACRDSFLNK